MSVNQHTETGLDRRQPSPEPGANLWRLAGPWWILLLTGIAWLIISVVVLRFTTTSAATVGVLLGAVFLAAMVNEFLIASVRWHWWWAHVLMGVIFLGGAIWSFVDPLGAFWTLATASSSRASNTAESSPLGSLTSWWAAAYGDRWAAGAMLET